jgi:hypothetical protein
VAWTNVASVIDIARGDGAKVILLSGTDEREVPVATRRSTGDDVTCFALTGEKRGGQAGIELHRFFRREKTLLKMTQTWGSKGLYLASCTVRIIPGRSTAMLRFSRLRAATVVL